MQGLVTAKNTFYVQWGCMECKSNVPSMTRCSKFRLPLDFPYQFYKFCKVLIKFIKEI